MTGEEDHSNPGRSPEAQSSSSDRQLARKIALVDGMVLVQRLTKNIANVQTIKDLSELFHDKLSTLTEEYDEVILVFDTYKADSLKRMTMDRRRHGQITVQYQIKD